MVKKIDVAYLAYKKVGEYMKNIILVDRELRFVDEIIKKHNIVLLIVDNYNQKTKVDRTQFRKWKQEYWKHEWDNGRWND